MFKSLVATRSPSRGERFHTANYEAVKGVIGEEEGSIMALQDEGDDGTRE